VSKIMNGRTPRVLLGRRFDLAGVLRSWLGTVLVIVALAIVFTALQPRFLSPLNLRNITSQMSVLLVISVAGTLPILLGSIDLSIASVATFAGIVLAAALQGGTVNGVIAVLIALLAAAALGLLNGLLFARIRIPSFLVTLGTLFAIDGLGSWLVHGTPIAITDAGLSHFFVGDVLGIPTIFLWALAVLAAATVFARYTRLGRHFYAVGGSEPAAVIAGINVTRVKVAAFVLSALLAGFSGVLLSFRALAGAPQQSAPLLLPAIGAIVIGGTALSGGVGGPLRTFIGVLLLTVLINGMQLLAVDPYLQLVVEGAVVIVAVVMSRERASVLTAVK
jgi:ribose/xylose/arabinose/galactoside ABC-type transport system permease subunit